MKRYRFPRHQRGMSLIELLVSIAIGLVILTAIGTAYINTTNTTRQRENLAELDDPAYNVMRMLKHNLTLAGYVDIFDLDAGNRARAASLFVPGNTTLSNMFVRATGGTSPPVFAPLSQFFPGLVPIFGCDGAMAGAPNTILTSPPPAAPACGAANATRHTLQIAYQGVPLSAANLPNSLLPANAVTGDGLDCLQRTPPAGQVMVINRFSAPAPAAGAVSQMNCEGSGAAGAQSIAGGVEEFVLRYQLAAPGDPLNPAAAGSGQQRYVNAAAVSNAGTNPQGWAGVTAVEICIVSATPTTSGPAAPGTNALQTTRPTCTRAADGAFNANIARAAGDTRLWKRYTSVVSLRNTVFATPL
ncbi:MAG: PilW family protein [Hydrogenophaga sp.]|jgi:prepilin-type N-terminal cleavage/methylation domain-containing protein|uniref:PilW family protein n=1 Tax=Hydrogenophaga sp. TaxID=1904254 RepID=UPI001D5A2949|nr:PilW family protein [Hydrogenophaga sp.]MBW0170269.1 PilW family protein [Hydrogenophaga sp.]MBW0184802.1 PilW family protein [Hydrogenophaga sp.]